MELVWCLCRAGVALLGWEMQPGKTQAGAWADGAVLAESGFLLPSSGHRGSAGILGQTRKPGRKWRKMSKSSIGLIEEETIFTALITSQSH